MSNHHSAAQHHHHQQQQHQANHQHQNQTHHSHHHQSHKYPLPVNHADILKVRALFESDLHTNPGLYHKTDIDRVRSEDWQIARFLQRTTTATDAFHRLRTTLRWKHSAGVHEKADHHFAREFYQINGVEILGRNQAGQLVVWSTSKYSNKFADLKPYIKQFVIHEIEAMDRMAGEAGMLVVTDARHVSMLSVDLEVTRFSNDILDQHYPGAVRRSLIVNLSLWMHSVFSTVLLFLNEEIRAITSVVTRAKLSAYLESHHIPVEYGGAREARVVRVPAHAPSYTEMAEAMELTPAQRAHYERELARLQL